MGVENVTYQVRLASILRALVIVHDLSLQALVFGEGMYLYAAY